MRTKIIFILLTYTITFYSQKVVVDSTYFSYESPCNIKIDFLKNKQIILTFENIRKLCFIKPLYDEYGKLDGVFKRIMYNNKLLYYVSFTDGVLISNQDYQIGCGEGSKGVYLYKLYSYNEKKYVDYYNEIEYLFNSENEERLNNKAFYLKSYKDYKTATFLLTKIIEKFPTRVVAYLNIADCYWEMKDKPKAIENYKKYIQLMTEQKKDLKKIPKYVYERVK